MGIVKNIPRQYKPTLVCTTPQSLDDKFKDSHKILVPNKYYNETIQTFENLGIKVIHKIKYDKIPCEIFIKCSDEIFRVAQEAVDEVVENNKLSTQVTRVFNKSRDFFFNKSSDLFEFIANKIIKKI